MAIRHTGVAVKNYVEALRELKLLDPLYCARIMEEHAEDILDAKREAREEVLQQIDVKTAELRKERITP
jgi:hypothetical protein